MPEGPIIGQAPVPPKTLMYDGAGSSTDTATDLPDLDVNRPRCHTQKTKFANF